MSSELKWQKLSRYLMELTAVTSDTWVNEIVGNIIIKPNGRIDPEAMILQELRYSAEFNAKGIPSDKAILLTVLITAWLLKHDPRRGLEAQDTLPDHPTFTLAQRDNSLADATFKISFIDPVAVVKAISGEIVVDGDNYQLGDEVANIPEVIGVEYKLSDSVAG